MLCVGKWLTNALPNYCGGKGKKILGGSNKKGMRLGTWRKASSGTGLEGGGGRAAPHWDNAGRPTFCCPPTHESVWYRGSSAKQGRPWEAQGAGPQPSCGEDGNLWCRTDLLHGWQGRLSICKIITWEKKKKSIGELQKVCDWDFPLSDSTVWE